MILFRICRICNVAKPMRRFALRKLVGCRRREKQCKDCNSRRAKEWADKHPDRRKIVEDRYRAKPSAVTIKRRYAKRRYLKNRVAFYQYHKNWRRLNPDKELDQVKRWQHKNRVKLGRWYLIHLARCAGNNQPTHAELKQQKLKTQLCRTKYLLKTLATAALLTP